MGRAGQALTPRAGYRFPAVPLLFTFAFLAVLAGVSHASEQAWLALALIPLVMSFQRMNAYRFLVVVLASYIVFFPAHLLGSRFEAGFVPDTLVFMFVFMLVLSRWKRDAVGPMPLNTTVFPMYAFVIYVLILTVRALSSGMPVQYIALDVRSVLYLPVGAALLALDGEDREPKKIFLLLASFVLFSSVHSTWVIGQFAASMERVLSWNEIFVSDAVIISALLLEMPVRGKLKWLLGICLALNVAALIVIQTRGLWLSTVFALALIYGFRTIASRTLKLSVFIWSLLLLVLVLIGGNLLLSSLTGTSLQDIILKRFTSIEPDEFINPYTSIGYRVHESWTVWDQRTIFGHGTGATLHIFTTLYRPGFYMDWWSIHNGYFEILHKFGFVGLGIFLWMYTALLTSGWRKARSGSRATALFGNIIVAVLLNHAFVSITAGYFLRWGTVVLMLLYFINGKLGSRKGAFRRVGESTTTSGA
jgi:O-antigen ligase